MSFFLKTFLAQACFFSGGGRDVQIEDAMLGTRAQTPQEVTSIAILLLITYFIANDESATPPPFGGWQAAAAGTKIQNENLVHTKLAM